MADEILLPFLKWAGGKRWLTGSSTQFVPKKFNIYIEPFLGSGAVFFALDPGRSILGDLNEDLINTYSAIKTSPREVQSALRSHANAHSKDYYYKVRSSKPRTEHTKAARFIYLNRTCWNGLYRVNLKGEFNVPKGTKDSVILDTDDFERTSKMFQNTTIVHQDFERTIEMARDGDFVFVDPPYTVNHNLNGFIKYNEKIFSWDDQVRLKEAIALAVSRGVQVTVSNADHESIRELYSDLCDVEIVNRASVIAGKSRHRKKTTEVLMRLGWHT